ncbi:MAG: HlyD family efflux transporter periplasmic adaptor subunit, partial [Clostridia bacterium]
TNFDKTVLVFSSSEIIDNFNYTRTQSVNITESSFSGIKIPVSALRMIDGKSGVYALDGNVVVYKQATVLYQENGYYICALPDKNNLSYVDKNKLSLYDAIVVSGKNIFVGKILS